MDSTIESWMTVAVAIGGMGLFLMGSIFVALDNRFTKGQYGAWVASAGLLLLLSAWTRGSLG